MAEKEKKGMGKSKKKKLKAIKGCCGASGVPIFLGHPTQINVRTLIDFEHLLFFFLPFWFSVEIACWVMLHRTGYQRPLWIQTQ